MLSEWRGSLSIQRGEGAETSGAETSVHPREQRSSRILGAGGLGIVAALPAGLGCRPFPGQIRIGCWICDSEMYGGGSAPSHKLKREITTFPWEQCVRI